MKKYEMEKWVSIKGYEKFYEVSNLGRVRSLDRPWKNWRVDICVKPGKVLKPQPNSKGYLRVELKVRKTVKRIFVHRLVAEHFLDNLESLPVVNHKDFNPKNNRAENLEWTDMKGNMRYSWKHGRFVTAKNKFLQTLERIKEKNKRSVIGTDLTTGEEIKFHFLNDVKKFGFSPSCVCNICKQKRGRIQHLGYTWRYAE